MKILDRYLAKQILIPFFICILTFSAMVMVIDLFNRLDEILKIRPPLSQVFSFYLHFIPLTFVQTSPIALLVSCLYSLGLLNKHHEITAMRASGLSLKSILMPFLFLACLVGALSFLVNETVVPNTLARMALLKEESLEFKKETSENILKNVALFAENGDLYYASSYDAKRKLLHDLVIFRDNEELLPVFKIQAQEAYFADGVWILSRGSKYSLDAEGKIVGNPVFFVKEKFESPVKPGDFLKAKREGEMMNLQELREHLRKLSGKASPSVIRRLLVEFHKRIAYPFANPVVILIGFPFVFREKKAVGMLRGIGISMILCFSFYATFVVTSNFGVRGAIPPWLGAWAANLLFGVGGFLFLWEAR